MEKLAAYYCNVVDCFFSLEFFSECEKVARVKPLPNKVSDPAILISYRPL